MAEIKPAEVSAILKQQLSGFTTDAQLEEVGSVLQVGDGIARIYGLNNVQAGELVEFLHDGVRHVDMHAFRKGWLIRHFALLILRRSDE